MSIASAYDRLADAFDGPVKSGESMARHTTYRIGGDAAIFATADTLHDLSNLISICEEEDVEYTVLGRGSNLLVSDAGYDGVVCVLGRDFKKHRFAEGVLRCGAGATLAHVVQDAFSKGLEGLEFAVGIPGTIGGALAMNAGTRDDWIGSRVDTVTLYEPRTGLTALRGHEVPWAYRASSLSARGIIVECTLRVEPGDTVRIRRVMEASLKRRKTSQPIGAACAGSVFVNPEGDSAGRLVEEAGLKGLRIGGAEVSRIHGNFIVNVGGATAADVLALIARVREAVMETHGIDLRPEIRFLGSFDET
ncbi:MAG: UDP-N-acetylmuramate dehydrogenase [Coriobacteriia bacterium]